MNRQELRSNDSTAIRMMASVDMKLEVTIIPVSDVDRANEFYSRLGWLSMQTAPPENASGRLLHFTSEICFLEQHSRK